MSSATSSPATPKAGRKDSPKVATSSKVSSLRKTSTNSSHSTSDHNGSSPGISKKISRAGSAVSATSVDRKPVVLVARSTSAAGDKKLASHLAHAPLPNTKTAALPIKTSGTFWITLANDISDSTFPLPECSMSGPKSARARLGVSDLSRPLRRRSGFVI